MNILLKKGSPDKLFIITKRPLEDAQKLVHVGSLPPIPELH